MPGVPRCIDHFRHRDDEFLVTSDCGPRTLTEDVVRNGPYQPGPAGPAGSDDSARGLGQLARQLARIVYDVHERGVIVRDLTPGNIVLQGSRISLVDFGLAAYESLHLAGGTPGYAPARQMRDETPLATDDLHALGMTLLFAATRLHPVVLGDHELPLVRARQAIRASWGPEPGEVIGAVTDLLAGGERARSALLELASGTDRRPAPVSAPRPGPAVTRDLVDEVRDSVLAELLHQVDQILAASPDTHAACDGCLYTGSAGIGLELLHHAGRAAVTDRLEELVTFTARAARTVCLPHGLYTGRTGVDIFAQQALERGITSARELDGPALRVHADGGGRSAVEFRGQP